MLLEAGNTCGRIAQAARATVLLDTADCFKMAFAAFRNARSTIHLLNWLLRAAGLERLTPLTPKSIGPLRSALASWHLGDPAGVADSWRPWRRVKALGDGVAAVRAGAKVAA